MNPVQSPHGIRKVVHWLRPRVRTIPVLGQAARYVKRLIVLPWNFHKQYQQSQTVQAETRGTFQTVLANQHDGFRLLADRGQYVEGKLAALNVAMARIAEQFSEADRQRQVTTAATHKTVIETAQSMQVEAIEHAATIEVLFAAVADRLSSVERRFENLDAIQLTTAGLVQQMTAIHERTSILPEQIRETNRVVSEIASHTDVVAQQLIALAGVPAQLAALPAAPDYTTQFAALAEVPKRLAEMACLPARLEALSERLTAQASPIADTITRLDSLNALPARLEEISLAVAQLAEIGPRVASAEAQIADTTTRAENEAQRFQGSVDERLDVLIDKFDSSIRVLSADVRGMNERHAAAFDLVSERLRDQTVRLLGMGDVQQAQGCVAANFASEQIADLVTGQLELARQIADLKQLVGGRNDGAIGNLRLRA